MSLLQENDLIEINLYYKYVKTDSGRKLIILDEKKGKEMIQKKENNVDVLRTKWGLLTWKEQNDVMNLSSQSINNQTGEKQFNFTVYRDAIIKRCLKQWNILDDKGSPVPLVGETIDALPGMVVASLYQQFESLSDYTEKELGN